MNGVPVPVVSCMLGHTNVRTTLRYTHLADRDIEAAAQWVGETMARAMAGGESNDIRKRAAVGRWRSASA